MVSQAASLATAHVQSRVVATAIVPLPPLDGADEEGASTET